MTWTSGSLTLGSPVAIAGGTLNVPGTTVTDTLVFTTSASRYGANAPHTPVLAAGSSDLYYGGAPISSPAGSGGDATPTGIYHSTDGGVTWTPIGLPLIIGAATASDGHTYYTHAPYVLGMFFISTTLHVYVVDSEAATSNVKLL